MATCCIPKVNFFNTNNFNKECLSFSKCSHCQMFALFLSMAVKVSSLVVHSGTLCKCCDRLGILHVRRTNGKRRCCQGVYMGGWADTHHYLFLVSFWICCITGCGHVCWLSFILLCCVKTVNLGIALSTLVSHQCLPLSWQLLVMTLTVLNLTRRRGVPECTIRF